MTRITGKQRAARKRNIKIARQAKKGTAKKKLRRGTKQGVKSYKSTFLGSTDSPARQKRRSAVKANFRTSYKASRKSGMSKMKARKVAGKVGVKTLRDVGWYL